MSSMKFRKGGQVLPLAGEEVVQNPDPLSAPDQLLDDVRADEARPPGDEIESSWSPRL